MKNSLLIFLIAIVQVSASVTIHGQNLTLMAEGKTVREVFKQIENETSYRFFYNEEFRDLSKALSFEIRDYQINEVLDYMLSNSNVTYRILENDLIVITPLSTFQGVTVTGIVTDALTGLPLPGASVVVRGTTIGTTSGINGEYRLTVPDRDAFLVFSFIGYITVETFIGENNVINVTLTEDVRLLDEIVVVGYGVQRRSDITGTVASMPRDRLEMVPNLNISQAIQGAVPGVMVQTTAFGAAPNEVILVRGRNSIKASNDPLIVVDGIPYGGRISDINPNDVQSIEILKDASAAAIYGSRGSNGVILVTTKEGTVDKATISYDGKYSHQTIAKMPRMMTGPEFYHFKMERAPGLMTPSEQAVYVAGTWTDWQDLSFRTGHTHEHNLSVAGGFGDTKYYLGGGFTDVAGVAVNDYFQRITARINVETKFNEWLSIGTRTTLSADDTSGEPVYFGGSIGAWSMNPLTAPYDEYGNLTISPWPESPKDGNPLQKILWDDIDKSKQIVTNNYAMIDVPFIKGLSYRLNTGFRFRFVDQARYAGRNTEYGNDRDGYARTTRTNYNNTVIENIVNYNRDFGAHSIFATGLYSYEGNEYTRNRMTAQKFPNDILKWYAAAQAEMIIPDYSFSEDHLISQMFRLNYGYDSRYLLTLTVRRDGYSGFGEQKKWGTFPSVALAWNLANENFFPWENLFNELKIRGSFGLNGNQAVGSYETISRLTNAIMLSGGITAPGYKPSVLGQDELGWESSLTYNFGVDFGILENRIYGNLNWYRTNTFDLLLDRTISPVHGITSITQNIGETENRGLEFSLSSRNIVISSFRWTTTGNFAFVKNKIVSLYGILDERGLEVDDPANAWFIGQPIRVIYDYVWDGIWQLDEAQEAAYWGSQPGFVKLRDVDGDGQLTGADRQIIGQRDPKLMWGMTNMFSYRNFILNVFIHGFHGNTKQNHLMRDNLAADVRRNTILIEDRWTPDNPTNNYYMNHDDARRMQGREGMIYESASFVRLKDVSLAYDIPASLIQHAGLGRLRLFVTGRNLATFTNFRGLDPELDNQDYIPLQREFVFGLNVGF